MEQKNIFKRAIIVTVYSLSSIATIDLNKYITKEMDFRMHFLLVVIQSMIIVAIILFQMSFTRLKIDFSKHTKWYLTSTLFSIMIFTGIKGIFYFSFTLLTLYKNLAIILVAIAEFYFFGRKITIIAMISFFIMIYSSLFGNSIDKIEAVGYIWMGANIISTAAFVLYMKKLMTIDQSSKFESVFFTNLLCIPFILILSLLFEEYYIPPVTLNLVSLIFLSGIAAYLTSFSTAWSLKVLSSPSYSMVGALNKLILPVSGFILFKEEFNRKKLISLLIGVASSFVYSLDQVKSTPVAEPSIIDSNANSFKI